MNIFNTAWSWRYYLRHPIKLIKEFFCNLYEAYRRIRYGWAYSDVWNLCDWFLVVMPQMLYALAADNARAYPGNDEFDTYEKWRDWLLEQASKLEKCREDGIPNEYEDAFLKVGDDRFISWLDESGNSTSKFRDPTPEEEEICHKFFERGKEIHEEQLRILHEVFEELGKNFYCLWS